MNNITDKYFENAKKLKTNAPLYSGEQLRTLLSRGIDGLNQPIKINLPKINRSLKMKIFGISALISILTIFTIIQFKNDTKLSIGHSTHNTKFLTKNAKIYRKIIRGHNDTFRGFKAFQGFEGIKRDCIRFASWTE